MGWVEASILMFGGLVALMSLGLSVAFGFLAINIVAALLFLGGEQGLAQLTRNAVQSVTSFSLTPIPFFVLMGEVLFHSGVALKTIDAFSLMIRRVPGRLAVIAIVAGTVFSAISGSTIATTALLGSLMLPTMLERGYDKKLAMGPIMGIGGVDMLIPPSALAVLLGSLAGISISGLLIGGIVWQYDRIAAWAVDLVSIEQEAKFGEIIFSQQKAGLKLVEGPALEMVKDIGGQLTANSRHKFQFFVTEDNAVNAYAMPGGFVVMHTGLLRKADTPEEVAGVLAHEVQHVERRHSLRRITQSLGLTAALSVLMGDMSGLASLGGDFLQLKFSRDHETEADREGLKVMVAAKINPVGMRDFFGKLAEDSKLAENLKQNLGFLSTHPASAERIADIDRLIKALPDEARQAESLKFDFVAIKASIGPRK
ncbi:MAG: M48 family metalloprotease [Hyphomicrobiales bacterium]